MDEGGLSAELYQSYFGQLFAAPALCESHEEGLPLPAPGAAEGAMQACGRLLAKMIVDGWCAQPFAPFLWHVLRDSHEDALSSSALALEQLAAFDPHKARSWRLLLGVAATFAFGAAFVAAAAAAGEAAWRRLLSVATLQNSRRAAAAPPPRARVRDLASRGLAGRCLESCRQPRCRLRALG